MRVNGIQLGGGSAGGGGNMRRSVYDANGDGVVDDSERLGGVAAAGYVPEVERRIVSEDIEATNVTSGGCYCIVIGSDGRTYFGGYSNSGIWVLDESTGKIVATNVTIGTCNAIGIGSDGRTYFATNTGVKILDESTGNIISTNITSGIYHAIGIGSDGRTYFEYTGVMVLNDATGDIEATNVTSGIYSAIGIGSDGRTYFGSDMTGIRVLDESTGNIISTNVTTGSCRYIGIASDGRTYFATNTSIKVLDESTGNIINTNVTTGTCLAIVIGSDGRTYFGGATIGIRVLDESTGNIISTNVTTETCRYIAIASDGRTYFATDPGIKVLDESTGNIISTNITSGTYSAIGIGSDGRTYFGSYTIGIWVLKFIYSSEHYVRHYGEWVDVEEFTGSKLDKEKTTDAYVSKFFHDDGGGEEGGQWVRADGAEIGALSRLGNRAVKRLVHVLNGLNGLGTRLMHTVSKIYYTKDADSEAYTDADEVATVGNVERYSTDEVKVGTWIDGKPVYKKTLHATTGYIADTAPKIIDIEQGFSIAAIIRHEAVVKRTDYNNIVPFNVFYGSTAPQSDRTASLRGSTTVAIQDDTKVRICSSVYASWLENTDLWVTVYYTKTTD